MNKIERAKLALGIISGRIRSQDIADDDLNSIGFLTWRHGIPPTELLREWAEKEVLNVIAPLILEQMKGENHEDQ